MNSFERLLYRKTTQDDIGNSGKTDSDLFSFWLFLKKQIAEKLSVVSSIFPHYSLHDSSHCEKILDIIWKLYGDEALNTLSVSNIFAILVSVYCHDLGMTVSSEDIVQTLDKDEFITLVKSIQDNTENPCYRYASVFDIDGNKLLFKTGTELDGDSFNAARFLLSIYFRNRHAERSQSDVSKILTTYNSYIKSSVIYQIGKICLAHNLSFADIMKMPKEENGIYGDSWNPLFIACSLRLGDLLDLESDRFSGSYWKSLPSKPYDSEFHKEKHEAIKHFAINNDIIEASAKCSDYNVYKLLTDEFEMVKNEISNQMSHWKSIAPNKNFVSLPCLGAFNVELEGYDTFDNGEVPYFHINQNKAFELIQGSGLYSDKFIAIREIIQNAVDATIIRVFLEHESHEKDLEFAAFKKILETEKIRINIRKQKEPPEEMDGKIVNWQVSISDNGIGMDKADLRYLLDAASSCENTFKNKILARMPEWLKPSGVFGLGFQSIFQLSDEIKVETRKVNSPYAFDLVLNNPSKQHNNKVLLKSKEADFSHASGTTVSFVFSVPVVPNSISVNIDSSFSNDVISNFDFVKEQSLDYEISKVIDAIQKFGSTSTIPIELAVENESVELHEQFLTAIRDRKFYHEYGFELFVPKTRTSLKYLFRNHVIGKSDSNIKFIPFSANIFSGSAKELLKYSREDFQKNNKVYGIFENTIKAGREYLIENYDKLSDDLKVYASMYVNYYEDETDKNTFSSEIFTKWESFTTPFDRNDIKFKDIVEFKGLIKLIINHGGNYRNLFFINKQQSDGKDEIIITTQFNLAEELCFLIKKLFKNGWNVSLVNYDNAVPTYEFSKDKNKDYFSDYTLCFSNALMANNFFSRFLIPCNAKYTTLSVTDKNCFLPREETFSLMRANFPLGKSMPVMISPYVMKRGKGAKRKLELVELDSLVDFTFKNRADEKTSKEEISRLFKIFVEETTPVQ